ncbi:MAG: hypothetical protein ACT6FC_05345, partial [Methanosarcinaceae archaeon]
LFGGSGMCRLTAFASVFISMFFKITQIHLHNYIKQYFGLEDFMNVEEVTVTNAANLAFFMVKEEWIT